MSISKDELVKRKEQIKKDFDTLVEQIKEQEEKIKSMKNNLNALAGASQQCDMFIKQIEDKAYELIKENNYRLKWGQIGPDLITDVVISNELIDNILDPTYFFPVPPNKIEKIFNPNIEQNEENEISKSFICHTWNEMFRKYNINKTIYPPRNSYLFNQFHINNIEYTSERKIYSKLFMLRFNSVISILFKLFSRIKVIIK